MCVLLLYTRYDITLWFSSSWVVVVIRFVRGLVSFLVSVLVSVFGLSMEPCFWPKQSRLSYYDVQGIFNVPLFLNSNISKKHFFLEFFSLHHISSNGCARFSQNPDKECHHSGFLIASDRLYFTLHNTLLLELAQSSLPHTCGVYGKSDLTNWQTNCVLPSHIHFKDVTDKHNVTL